MPVNYFPKLRETVEWGKVAGNIIDQIDLQNELSQKAELVHTHSPEEVGIFEAINEPNALQMEYNFTGISSKFVVTGGDELSFADAISDKPFSIIAYFSIAEAGRYEPIISKIENTPEYTLQIDPQERVVFRLYSGLFSDYLEISSNAGVVIPNQVYYLAAVYDGSHSGSGLSLYLNGELLNTEISQNNYSGMTAGNSDLLIGNFNSYYFKGNISNICIISDYLNADNIREISYKGKFIKEEIFKKHSQNLILLLDDDSTYRNVWLDKSGNKHNAIPENIDYLSQSKINEILYYSGINSNTVLYDFIPKGYFITEILFNVKSGAEIGKKANIGITATGDEIVSTIELDQIKRYKAQFSDNFFDSDTTIYINDSNTQLAWNAGTQLTFDITIYLKLTI